MSDARWIAAAVALAERARGRTGGNPNVGCVIVRDGRVVGRGWTQDGGRPHAEAMALAEAGSAARGAAIYVTLEPCAHESDRGPACAGLVTGAGVVRVVAAVRDPDARTDGKGFGVLRGAGVEVVEGVGEAGAWRAMAGWLMQMAEKRPLVTLKLATSLDGCIATAAGESKWITGEAARGHGHLERARSDLVVVGRGTFEADAPGLDVRLAGLEDRSPERAVLTQGGAEVGGWIVLRSPEALYDFRGQYVLVEGGAGAAGAFLTRDLVDRMMIYRAPIVIGGKSAMSDIGLGSLADAHGRWTLADTRMLGSDRLEVYERNRCSQA